MDHVPETTSTTFPKQTLVQGRRAGTADLALEDTRAPGKGAISQAQPKTPLCTERPRFITFAGTEAPSQAFCWLCQMTVKMVGFFSFPAMRNTKPGAL